MVAASPRFPAAVTFLLALLASFALAQGQAPTQPSPQSQKDPLKVPLQQGQGLRPKLSPYYSRWINEDVRWIITDEELAAWKKLTSDAERDLFIDAFWARRDPTPDTEENEYKEEHYRRVLYANEYFGAGVPGWRTDRGRIYILYGKPDSIDAHPNGGSHQRPMAEGGGKTEIYPFEIWRYRYIEGIGQDIEIEFVDTCRCGEYHMTLDRSKKDDALVHVPSAVPPETEPTRLANNAKQYDRLSTFARLNRAPEVKFKDLEAVVNTRIRYNLLPLEVRVDFVRITADTVLVPITLQLPNSSLTFVNKDGVQRATVNIFGRMMTLTGKIVATFEEQLRLDVPPELLSKVINNAAVYWKALPVKPGHYRLDVAVKDVNGDKLGTWSQDIVVPEFEDGKLAASALILADLLESVPAREVSTGSFVLGTTKVRPKVPSAAKPPTFRRELNQKVNFWMQVYNLAIDGKTRRPSASIEYQVVNTSTNQPVVDFTENTETMKDVSDQLTLQKSLPSSKLAPGAYQITIKVTDLITKQSISPTARFVVE